MNDIIFPSLYSAGIPASKKPTSLTRLCGKRPGGLTLVPWQGDTPVTWDVTVVSTIAQSYLHTSGHSAAGAEELTVSRNEAKYYCLHHSFLFVPIALETLGAIAPCCLAFFTEVDRRLSAATGDARETPFLLQRISVELQQFNVLIHESFVTPDVEPDL